MIILDIDKPERCGKRPMHNDGNDYCKLAHDHASFVRAKGCPIQTIKTGHWIGHREHCENLGVIPSGLGAYKWCSNCDCGIDVREWHRNNYNYCPNCGCRMVEPQESEDKE